MMTDNSLALLQATYLGNSIQTYAMTIALFLGLLFSFRVIFPLIFRGLSTVKNRLQRSHEQQHLETFIKMPSQIWLLLSLTLSLQLLVLPSLASQVLRGASLAIVVGMTIVVAQRLLEHVIIRYLPGAAEHESPQVPSVLHFTLTWLLWSVGVLLVLSNIGVNVISLVAGLGIGGIALALAAQNILGDIFSSFSLFFDRPFTEGDFIIVGEHMGTVKKIGMKTTRLASIDGEEIVIPNAELTSTRVRNFRRMKERRVVFTFGLTYDTPPSRVREIPPLVQDVIGHVEDARFGRAHFKSFGDSSLNFEVVYYLNGNDYDQFMNAQQAINVALLERLGAIGVQFAFPTRTVHLASAGNKEVSGDSSPDGIRIV